jgi:hypothetical protein
MRNQNTDELIGFAEALRVRFFIAGIGIVGHPALLLHGLGVR